jgi:protein TonB
MRLRPWHLVAAFAASVTLHFGAVALTVKDAPIDSSLIEGSGGQASMLGEAFSDMLTAGDPEASNSIAAESPDTLAPVDPEAAETEVTDRLTPTETPVEQIQQQVAEIQPQDVSTQETATIEDAALLPLANAEAVIPVNETPEEKVEAVEPVPVPEVRPKDLPVKVAEAEPEPPVKKKTPPKQVKKPEAQRPPSSQNGKNRVNATQGAGGNAAQTATQGGSLNQSGSNQIGNADRTNYKGKIERKLRNARRSVKIRDRGTATVFFVVRMDGSLGDLKILSSSGIPEVDDAALKLVRRAAPFPPIPLEEGAISWDFKLPIEVGG